MKRILGLTLLLTSLTCFCFSQEELNFKVAYNPSTKYSQTIKQTSFTEVKYAGSDEILKVLQEKGVQNPTITETASISESEFNTGKLTDKIHFPVTMKFIKTTSSDGKVPIPDGTVIYGKGSIGNMPTLDSIASAELSEDYKANLLKTLGTMFSQITFPEKKLKPGEEFSQETSLSIPIAGVNLEMAILTNYKLVRIVNRIGNFDITQAYTMKSITSKYPIKAIGNGKGTLEYDISNTNYIKYLIDTDIDIEVQLEKFSVIVKSKSGFMQSTIIVKN